jgi:hypothetical protein
LCTGTDYSLSVATAAELDLDTFAERLRVEVVQREAACFAPTLVSVIAENRAAGAHPTGGAE